MPIERSQLCNRMTLLGFDHFERMLDQVNKSSSDGYPPYNVEQIGDNQLRITLAVAGFTENDLSIQIEGNQLVVRGKQQEDGDAERVFIYRGIATRQFQRSFVLADGIEVEGAELDNGLLYIDLLRPLTEERVRTVEIRSGNNHSKSLETKAE